jgi:hypothetical protein
MGRILLSLFVLLSFQVTATEWDGHLAKLSTARILKKAVGLVPDL